MADNVIIDKIIEKIYLIQKNAIRKYWNSGIFPNYRSDNLIGIRIPDNSIFHSASIVLILKNIETLVSKASNQYINEITKNVTKNYSDYQSATHENIYNFYPTKPSKHFANGLIFKYFKHFQLPHDADDTALVFLTEAFSKEENARLQIKLKLHANDGLVKNGNISYEYKNFSAYSTWFGKNMPIEFDAVVLSNILYSQLEAGLVLDQFGLDSWKYIKEVIFTGNYISNPFVASPNYNRTPIIAYHVVKLITRFSLPDRDKMKEILKGNLIEIFENMKEFSIDKLLISSSLYRLGQNHKFDFDIEKIEPKVNSYVFFIAGLLSAYENKWIHNLAKYPLFQLKWTCPAHTWVLILENLILYKFLDKKRP